MRPDRIELEGFATFREPTTIELQGAELFAFTGATGAGKSTIIDAICFALYGVVPRLNDRKLVAPVISQGRLEARVRVDFTVAGRSYTAVRVVRATPKGATTKEARLERNDDHVVLAGTEKELSAAVEQLLGLSYQHFTTCVVLPQGDFARFLHDKPSERQDLLVELLDLGVYGRMRSLAKTRESVAKTRRELGAAELARLSFATPERHAELTARVQELAAVLAVIDDAQPRLDGLATVAVAARTEAEQARTEVARLAALAVPRGTATLADRATGAKVALEEAKQRAADAADALLEATAAVDAAVPRATLDAVLRDRGDLDALVERIAQGHDKIAALRAAADATATRAEEARVEREAAALALDDARRADRAEEFVLLLAVGEPCPICRQAVHDLPAHEGGHVAAAAKLLKEADTAWAAAVRAADEAARAFEKADTLLTSLVEQQAQLAERLADRMSADQATAELERLAAAEDALAGARQAEAGARSRARAAETELAAAEAQAADAWRTFDATRDGIAHLGPPPAERHDLHVAWAALVAFARDTGPVHEQRAADALARADAADADRQRLLETLRASCLAAQIEPGDQPARTVGAAMARAEADLAAVADALGRVTALRAEDLEHETAEKLARALALHLNADRFETWVLDESLSRLVAGATTILAELSKGTFSLTLDPRTRSFCVIDHANADTVRSARTLSGGETFLASLSLALALADEVAQMAAGGAARLDSIFLDEGFGTLDADTLDTVAGALEELQARGRMVGVISHVPELAERMPVRFHVVKGANGSTVTRSET